MLRNHFFFDILEYYVLLEKGKGTLLGNLSLFPDVFFLFWSVLLTFISNYGAKPEKGYSLAKVNLNHVYFAAESSCG